MNKENITITGISDRIKNYINKLQPSYESINMSIKEHIQNDVRISSKHALNIFRIVQEAVHNALKHSNANNIDVGIESTDALIITITDNGSGIAAARDEGNGLTNIKSRAAESGMHLEIATAGEGGTSVTLKQDTIN